MSLSSRRSSPEHYHEGETYQPGCALCQVEHAQHFGYTLPHRIYRRAPGSTGWCIANPDGTMHVLFGRECTGLTRWEARQTCGMLGLTYTEDTA